MGVPTLTDSYLFEESQAGNKSAALAINQRRIIRELQGKLATSEQRERNSAVDIARLKRELSEAKSKGNKHGQP